MLFYYIEVIEKGEIEKLLEDIYFWGFIFYFGNVLGFDGVILVVVLFIFNLF